MNDLEDRVNFISGIRQDYREYDRAIANNICSAVNCCGIRSTSGAKQRCCLPANIGGAAHAVDMNKGCVRSRGSRGECKDHFIFTRCNILLRYYERYGVRWRIDPVITEVNNIINIDRIYRYIARRIINDLKAAFETL